MSAQPNASIHPMLNSHSKSAIPSFLDEGFSGPPVGLMSAPIIPIQSATALLTRKTIQVFYLKPHLFRNWAARSAQNANPKAGFDGLNSHRLGSQQRIPRSCLVFGQRWPHTG